MHQGLLCERRRGGIATPPKVQPEVTPAPDTAEPVETPDNRVTAGVVIFSSPEKDVTEVSFTISLPVFGDELRVSEKIVKHIGVVHEIGYKLLTELVTLNGSSFLLVRRKMKGDLGEIQNHLTILLMLLNLPAAWNEWRCVTVYHIREGSGHYMFSFLVLHQWEYTRSV